MKVMLIGRTKNLIETAKLLDENGHEIVGVITSKAALEYDVNESDFRSFSEKLNIPFLHSPNVNLKDLKVIFGKTNPDIAVSINYSGIISAEVIDFFPLGVLNAHGGDLPKYRGNACQAWAIINGEERIGLCIHKMIGGELDSGDIIARKYITLDDKVTIKKVYDEFEVLIPRMFLESINQLEKNNSFLIEEQSKNIEDALRCYPRKPEDGKIDWNSSAVQIHRLIRASSEPYSGAFSYLDGEKIIIWKSKLLKSNEKWLGIPGQIAEIIDNGDVIVLTGEGKIILQEIEFNKKRLRPSLIIKSIRKRLT